jgi:hypothetical protein
MIALAALTKYYGVCLIPLLAVYSLIGKRPLGQGRACLLIPVLALVTYHWTTRALYGRSLLVDAAEYATTPKEMHLLLGSKMASILTALGFTGGGLAVATFFAPLLWRARVLGAFVAGTILFATALLGTGMILKN